MYEQDTHLMESLKVSSYPKAFNHVIYLDEAISNSAYYRNAILTLKTASPEDSVEIIFNTEGGLCHTASVFCAAMKECQAPIIGNLSGLCASAGTLISLHCDSWKVDDDLVYMLHTASYGAANSAEKLRDQVKFTDKWVTEMNTRAYKGFLTDEEIEAMVEHGKEYWFNAEEVRERLENYGAYRESSQMAEIQQAMEDQWAEEDAVADEALATLVAKGKYTQADVDLFKRIIEDADKVLEGGECESPTPTQEPSLCSFIADGVSDKGGDTSFLLKDLHETVWEITFTQTEDDFEDIEIENTSSGILFGINRTALEDEELETLKELADLFEIAYAHNIGKARLVGKIIEFFELTLIDLCDK